MTIQSMSSGEVRHAMNALGLKNAELAELLGISLRAAAQMPLSGTDHAAYIGLMRGWIEDAGLLARYKRLLTEPGPEAPARPRGRPPKPKPVR
jgi:hypothetical protein